MIEIVRRGERPIRSLRIELDALWVFNPDLAAYFGRGLGLAWPASWEREALQSLNPSAPAWSGDGRRRRRRRTRATRPGTPAADACGCPPWGKEICGPDGSAPPSCASAGSAVRAEEEADSVADRHLAESLWARSPSSSAEQGEVYADVSFPGGGTDDPTSPPTGGDGEDDGEGGDEGEEGEGGDGDDEGEGGEEAESAEDDDESAEDRDHSGTGGGWGGGGSPPPPPGGDGGVFTPNPGEGEGPTDSPPPPDPVEGWVSLLLLIGCGSLLDLIDRPCCTQDAVATDLHCDPTGQDPMSDAGRIWTYQGPGDCKGTDTCVPVGGRPIPVISYTERDALGNCLPPGTL